MLCLSYFGAGALRCHGAAAAFCAEQSVDFLCGGAAVERAVFAARANIAQTVTFIAEQHSREIIVRAKRFGNRFACVKIDRQVCRNEMLLCFGMQLFAVQFCKLRVFLAELLVQALHLFFLASERVEHAVRLYGKCPDVVAPLPDDLLEMLQRQHAAGERDATAGFIPRML